MMADELNSNKETIRQILREDLQKRKICSKFVPHRPTDEQKQRRLTSCQGFIQTCQDKQLSSLRFLFSHVKTSLKGKRRQDVEGIKENVAADLNALPLEAFPDCFKYIINEI
jgi:hypothetical protein